MTCEYRNLKKNEFPKVYRCFLEAFADYHLDMSYMNEQSMYNRMVKNGLDMEASVGVFDKDKMVGFTLVGVDDWNGVKAAFDSGTGIIPEYRGKGIAKKMFDFSLPALKERRIKMFLLEVLQVNEAGVKAYKKTGFHITREFDCYQLKPEDYKPKEKSPNDEPVTIRPVGREILSDFKDQLDWQPSWENSFSSAARIPDELNLYGAYAGETCVGILVYYPALKWILSLLVRRDFRRRGIASRLISHFIEGLPAGTESVSVVNVEHTDTGMTKFLENQGFNVHVTQYEMALDLGL